VIEHYAMSERRACRLLNLARSTKRYQSWRSERDQELKQQLRAWAEKRPRFGYRRLRAEQAGALIPNACTACTARKEWHCAAGGGRFCGAWAWPRKAQYAGTNAGRWIS